MRRSIELSHSPTSAAEEWESSTDQEEINRHLARLANQYHELSVSASPDDYETLHDMRQLNSRMRRLKVAQFSVEHL